MSNDKKEFTPEELLDKMLSDWDARALKSSELAVIGHWHKQADVLLKRANKLGDRYVIAMEAKLSTLQDELGITETKKRLLDEADKNAQRIINDVRRRTRRGRFAGSRPDTPTPKTENQPPVRAEKLLYLALPKRLRDSLIGCLEEEFTTLILPKFGPSFASVWYWKQAVCSVVVVAARELVKLVGLAWLGKAASWLYGKFGS
jgi:hypothetical protein